MDYAVSIATRGRTNVVEYTVTKYLHQTFKPKKILIIDNNDDSEISAFLQNLSNIDETVEVVVNDMEGKTDGHGTHFAFEYLKDDFEYIMKADDDLFPKRDFMQELSEAMLVEDNIVAVGGMYPRIGENGISFFVNNEEYLTADFNKRHFQFFNFFPPDGVFQKEGPTGYLKTHHLYSSFLYRVETAEKIGGYPYCYKFFRYETDFTLRLGQFGNLLINPKAVARHGCCGGGIRDITPEQGEKDRAYDLELFDKRMKDLGIDPDY